MDSGSPGGASDPACAPGAGRVATPGLDAWAAPPRGKYVYCIIKSAEDREFGPIGIGEGCNPVYTIHYQSLAAVVSDAPLRTFHPTRENVLAHELVNQAVLKEHTVLPMSFGTVFRARDDVVALLRSTYRVFDDILERIRERVEFGLKVLWDRKAMVAGLGLEGRRGRTREQTDGGGRERVRPAGERTGPCVDRVLEEKINALVAEIHGSLKPVAVASRSNPPIGDRMILNAAYLVERAREREFDGVVKALGRGYEGLLRFNYTGPWPPYNFVNITLRLERTDA